jgi:hypothetical protein
VSTCPDCRLSSAWVGADTSWALVSWLLLLLVNVHEVVVRVRVLSVRPVENTSVYHQSSQRIEVSTGAIKELRRHIPVELRLHEVIREVITRRLVSRLASWVQGASCSSATSSLHFLGPVLLMARASGKITLIQKLIGSWTYRSPVHRLVKL